MKKFDTFFKTFGQLLGYHIKSVHWPKNLSITLTRKCNARCIMCKVHANDTPENAADYKDMPDELFCKIEPLIRRASFISLGGSGEPSAACHFVERVKRIRQLNPRAKLQIYTNGLAFSSLDFAQATAPLFDCIQISLNGVASYEHITKGGSLEQIEKGLLNIQTVRGKYKKPKKVVVGFVLMKKNIADIVPAAMIAKKFGADAISYKDLWVRDDSMKLESLRHNPDLAQQIKKEIEKVVKTGFPVVCSIKSPWPQFHKKNMLRYTVRALPKIIFSRTFIKELLPPCDKPWSFAQVFEGGNIYLCCSGSTMVGNLLKNDFEEIWHSPETMCYRNGLLTRNYYKDCAKCKHIAASPGAYER
ncbi:MAG: SPASM domain-containing protein [Candidatus Omnitrophica bacterium]|nr:SPASM domain-containing protein [Candidatus Omnitrophota bacterium]